MSMNKEQYKVTFINKGYVVSIFYNYSSSKEEAIESAKLYNSNKYTSVRAELVRE